MGCTDFVGAAVAAAGGVLARLGVLWAFAQTVNMRGWVMALQCLLHVLPHAWRRAWSVQAQS